MVNVFVTKHLTLVFLFLFHDIMHDLLQDIEDCINSKNSHRAVELLPFLFFFFLCYVGFPSQKLLKKSCRIY